MRSSRDLARHSHHQRHGPTGGFFWENPRRRSQELSAGAFASAAPVKFKRRAARIVSGVTTQATAGDAQFGVSKGQRKKKVS